MIEFTEKQKQWNIKMGLRKREPGEVWDVNIHIYDDEREQEYLDRQIQNKISIEEFKEKYPLRFKLNDKIYEWVVTKCYMTYSPDNADWFDLRLPIYDLRNEYRCVNISTGSINIFKEVDLVGLFNSIK